MYARRTQEYPVATKVIYLNIKSNLKEIIRILNVYISSVLFFDVCSVFYSLRLLTSGIRAEGFKEIRGFRARILQATMAAQAGRTTSLTNPQIPQFNGKNYEYWSITMKALFCSQDNGILWITNSLSHWMQQHIML